MLGIHAPGRIVAAGPHRTLVKEFGAGLPIAQSFTIANNGLQEIRFLTSASRAARHDLMWALAVERDAVFVPVVSARRAIDVPAGEAWHAIRFPVVDDSAGHTYRLEIRLPQQTAKDADLAIVASLDDVHPGGFLVVNGEQRWGDLVFTARSAEDTVAGRFFLGTVRRLSPPLNSRWIWAAIVIALHMALWLFFANVFRGRTMPQVASPIASRGRVVSVAILAALLAASAGAVLIGRRDDTRIDLLEQMYEARMEYHQALHWNLYVFETSIGGEIRRSLYAHAMSQVTWTVTVPAGGRLRTALGIMPGAWGFTDGDGVVFRIGVTENGRHSELFARRVDPAHAAADKRWIPVDIDLSPFAGRQIDIVLRTDPSMPGAPPNAAYDWALWGSPRIAVGRERKF